MTASINQLLEKFESVSLAQLNEVALMKRVDTKFILNLEQLQEVMSELVKDYKVLEIDGLRLFTYNSTYFDTPEARFYHDHHNQRRMRIKVRQREYVESGLAFLEVKQKDAKGNTVKTRARVDSLSEQLPAASSRFVSELIGDAVPLHKTLHSSFKRFTLMNHERHERVTVDLSLGFNGESFNERLVIVELKQQRFDRASPIVGLLKEQGVFPTGLSKYCIGMASGSPGLKQNLWKQKLRMIDKVTR